MNGEQRDGGLRERKKQETRESILRAAAQLFASNGFDATTVARICELARVAPRTFFTHFPSKEDLLFHHIEDYAAMAVEEVRNAAPGESLPACVQRALSVMIKALTEGDTASEFAAYRAALFESNKGLPRSLIVRLIATYGRIADALRDRFPEDFDRRNGAAMLGACLGSVSAAAVASMQREENWSKRREAMLGALHAAANGFAASTHATAPSSKASAPPARKTR